MALRNLVDDRDLKQIVTHKRVALDGIAYTKQEFQDFYGESQGHYRWSLADVAPDDLADVATSSSPQPKPPPAENMLFQAPATEHAFHAPLATMPENPSHVASDSSMSSAAAPALPKCPPPPVASSSSMSRAGEPTLPKRPPPPGARSSSPQPVASSSSRSRAAESTSRPDAEPQRFYPQPRIATEQPRPDAEPVQSMLHPPIATEHGEQPLQLMPEDVRAIQRAERDRGPPRPLHQLARNALNDIEDRDPPIDVSLDNEFPWREYIAAHNESAKIIGTGIVQARAVFFKDQKDPNRGGAPRLDFCFVRSDGSVCRVHPGDKRRNDAKLRFARRSVVDCA